MEPVSQIKCPSCQHVNNVFSKESTLFACISCPTVFIIENKATAHKSNKEFLRYGGELSLGAELKHNGSIFTVTGKLVKYEENDKHAIWCEYFLTNPEEQNIYLSCWNGHWSIIEELPDFESKWKQSDVSQDLNYEGTTYTYFHKYKIRIAYLEGEFNFDVYQDNRKNAFEYINPPYTIILEYNKETKELSSFKATYLYKGELRKKLLSRTYLSDSTGIAGNQPFYWNANPSLFYQGSFVILFVFLLLQLFIRYVYPPVNITSEDYRVYTEDSSKVYSFNSFKVPYDNALMDVKMFSDYLNNDWVAAEMTLVNDVTGDERNFVMEAERYSGYTDGESWSEGDNESRGNIKAVEKGEYHFEITPYQQLGSSSKTMVIHAEVYKGSWSVFWLSVIILVVANIVFGIAHDYFEHAKWGEDYDTFNFSD